MPDDLWTLTKRGPDGKKLPSKRAGRGKRWRVRYDDDAGQPKSRLFEREADAKAFEHRVNADVDRGAYVDPGAGRATVTEYAARWRETRMHGDSTAEKVEIAFRVHVAPTPLGHLRMRDVRSSHIQAWVRDRSDVLAPSTLEVIYTYLRSMFSTAEFDREITTSPCRGNITLPEVDRPDRYIPTPDQVHALAESLPPQLRAMAYVGAGTGLRLAEAFGLEVEHVQFLGRDRMVAVRQQMGRDRTLRRCKTKYSVRDVELPEVTANAVAWHLERFPPAVRQIEDRTNPRKPVVRPARLLFLSARGLPMVQGSWYYPWLRARMAVGLPDGVGFHNLRHYFATLLIHAGASVKTVQMALGHANPTITLNTYAGEWPEAVDRTRAIVDLALGEQRMREEETG